MKKYSSKLITIASLLALTVAFAIPTLNAQEAAKKAPRAPSKADIAKYDTNKDGALDEAETAAMKTEKKAIAAAKKKAKAEQEKAQQN